VVTTIRCPECGLKYKVREGVLGRKVRCHRGHVFLVPIDPHAAAAPANATERSRSTQQRSVNGTSSLRPSLKGQPSTAVCVVTPIIQQSTLKRTAAGKMSRDGRTPLPGSSLTAHETQRRPAAEGSPAMAPDEHQPESARESLIANGETPRGSASWSELKALLRRADRASLRKS
jgi:hypothetical protein